MKFGFRKPSIKKSIKARTTGRIKRTVNKTINPVYGKKGMGFINNPKKAVYNSIYNKTTFGIGDIIEGHKKNGKSNLAEPKHKIKNSNIKVNSNYVNVNDRDSIYSNSTNTYTSSAGKKCIEYEKSLLKRANNYKQKTCPYCNSVLEEIPKRAKKCPFCGNKIHIVNSGINQGMMLLTSEESDKLYDLKDVFYKDKQSNPNY